MYLTLLNNCFCSFSLLLSSLTYHGVHIKNGGSWVLPPELAPEPAFQQEPPGVGVQEPPAMHGETARPALVCSGRNQRAVKFLVGVDAGAEAMEE